MATERFLLVHPEIHLSFAAAETHSLLQITRCRYIFETLEGVRITEREKEVPLLTVLETEKDAVDYLLSRSMLVSYAILLPQINESVEQLFAREEKRTKYMKYRIDVVSYKRKLQIQEKLALMDTVSHMLKDKSVCLKTPDIIACIIEYDSRVITGILHAKSNRKHLLHKYCIKKREFIGTTAMDNEIAFIMANLAQVSDKSIVFDCFNGTGSILIPCAALGACVLGADSNPKQYKGLSTFHTNRKIRTLQPGTDIYTNFHQFNLYKKAILFCISDIFEEPILRRGVIDAMICDPPYGRRESTKKTPFTAVTTSNISDKYIISSLSFIKRMFEHASYLLKSNGFLCFFVPHRTEYFLPNNIDLFSEFSTTKFILICTCRQYLNALYSRTLFLYKRTVE